MALVHIFPLLSPWMTAKLNTLDHLKTILQRKKSTILSGPSSVGKTSLLFQSAVTHASENYMVTYICREPLSHLPLQVHGMPGPDPAVLQSFKFIYLSSVRELIDWCAKVHTMGCLPDMLIVDDIDVYGSQIKDHGLEHGVATVLALVVDAAAFIKQKNGQCPLLMSASERTKALHSVYKQFHLADYSIHVSQSTDGEFALSGTVEDKHRLSVTYQIGDSNIKLKNVQLESSVKPLD